MAQPTLRFGEWGFLSFWLEGLVNLSIYCMDMMFICLDSMIIFLSGILYHYQCDLGRCLFSPSTGSFGNVSASPTSVFVLFRIKVERDGWDEARLRALCARHGWEFEWMTDAWLNHSDSGNNLLVRLDLAMVAVQS